MWGFIFSTKSLTISKSWFTIAYSFKAIMKLSIPLTINIIISEYIQMITFRAKYPEYFYQTSWNEIIIIIEIE